MADSIKYISNKKTICLKFSSDKEEDLKKELQKLVREQNESGYRLMDVQVIDENDQETCLRLLFNYVID